MRNFNRKISVANFQKKKMTYIPYPEKDSAILTSEINPTASMNLAFFRLLL